MAGDTHSIESQATIAATFPPIQRRISGQPTLLDLLDIYRHDVECAGKFTSRVHALNCTFVAVPAGLWPMCTNLPYPAAPPDPGEQPMYNPNGSNAENAAIKDAFLLARKYSDEHGHMNRALIDRMLDILDPSITQTFKENQLRRDPKMQYLVAFNYFFRIYGIPNERIDKENQRKLEAKWMPQSGIDALITQIEHGVIFAYFTNNPFTDKQLVNAFMLQITNAGVYSHWIKEWRQRDDNDKTYRDAKNFWQAAHIQWMQEARAGDLGYGLNAQTYDADADDVDDDQELEQEQQAAEQRINQHAANHAAAMGDLAQRLDNIQLQQQMSQQMMANVMANQQQQRQFNNNGGGDGGGRRYNGRNNNNNGGNNWNGGGWMQGAWNAMPYCPPAPQFQYNNGGGGGGGQRNNNSNNGRNNGRMDFDPRRWFENTNFCSTHGFHVEDDHTSATCKMPGPNHNFTAMQPYPGCVSRGSHKTIMPSQCGRQPNRNPQPEPTPGYLAWKAAGFPNNRRNNNNRGTFRQGGNFQQGNPMQQQPPQQQQANLMFQQQFAGMSMGGRQNNNFNGNGGMNGGFGGYNNGFGGNMGRNF